MSEDVSSFSSTNEESARYSESESSYAAYSQSPTVSQSLSASQTRSLAPTSGPISPVVPTSMSESSDTSDEDIDRKPSDLEPNATEDAPEDPTRPEYRSTRSDSSCPVTPVVEALAPQIEAEEMKDDQEAAMVTQSKVETSPRISDPVGGEAASTESEPQHKPESPEIEAQPVIETQPVIEANMMAEEQATEELVPQITPKEEPTPEQELLPVLPTCATRPREDVSAAPLQRSQESVEVSQVQQVTSALQSPAVVSKPERPQEVASALPEIDGDPQKMAANIETANVPLTSPTPPVERGSAVSSVSSFSLPSSLSQYNAADESEIVRKKKAKKVRKKIGMVAQHISPLPDKPRKKKKKKKNDESVQVMGYPMEEKNVFSRLYPGILTVSQEELEEMMSGSMLGPLEERGGKWPPPEKQDEQDKEKGFRRRKIMKQPARPHLPIEPKKEVRKKQRGYIIHPVPPSGDTKNTVCIPVGKGAAGSHTSPSSRTGKFYAVQNPFSRRRETPPPKAFILPKVPPTPKHYFNYVTMDNLRLKVLKLQGDNNALRRKLKRAREDSARMLPIPG